MPYSPSQALRAGHSPLRIFSDWMKGAERVEPMAEAMTVATATAKGLPSARTLLLKKYGTRGFTFFTNAQSRQGREMAENPRAALLFYWKSLKRQVRIEGDVSEIPLDETDAYFHSRPYVSQIGALASKQSAPLESHEALLEEVRLLEGRHPSVGEVPRPDYWKGYLLKPHHIEFWEDGAFRLHDRAAFDSLSGDAADPDDAALWRGGLLYP